MRKAILVTIIACAATSVLHAQSSGDAGAAIPHVETLVGAAPQLTALAMALATHVN